MKTASSRCASFRCAGILIAASCFLAPLHAATRHVDPSGGAPNDGNSWATAFVTLQDALASASAGDEIWIAEGTYYPDEGAGTVADDRTSCFTLIDEVEIYGGFPAGGGDATFGARDPGTYPTILSGDIGVTGDASDNAYHVVLADAGDVVSPATVLDGVTITGGNANAGSSPGNRGGGIYLQTASPRIVNTVIAGNQANQGGGIYHLTNASPTLINCTITGNSAAFGGGITNNTSSPALINCTLSGNLGAAILNAVSSSQSLTSCIVWNNGASVNDNASITSYSHCLVEGLNPAGPNNLDGTQPANDPLFVAPADPLTAPNTTGDLRLLPGSPCLDIGNSVANTTATDLAGNPRIHGTAIDLGAYEFSPVFVKANATGTGDGSSWTDAFPKLQDALAAATSGTTILVAAGTYYPDETATSDTNDRTATFALVDGVVLLGGYAGNETDLSLRDPSINETILSGDINQSGSLSGNAYHVLTADAVGPLTLLDGFTITAGNGNDSNFGGGLHCTNAATPSLANCSFSGNYAFAGGALANDSSSPSLTDCSFSGNSEVSWISGPPTFRNPIHESEAPATLHRRI
ncbi:right-handed parallel beta-helix repeat-containing protein, partial [Luteolibacter marinus]|uniref:right-handed parallel beta-helix repeat-containing protein n=1 Tax=Luteolibacter marinus TaxID=2776705 RepID=UPI001D00AD56